MQAYYNGEHKVFFGELGTERVIAGEQGTPSSYIDSWADLHLIPVSRPTISVPALRDRTIDIPGANGSLDLTDVPRGFPVFGNRTGNLDFYIDHGRPWGMYHDEPYDWTVAYADITRAIHGKRTKLYLGDDIYHYYYGRFAVSGFTTDKLVSKVSISYNLDPYEYSTAMVWDGEIFDPFTGSMIPSGSPYEYMSRNFQTDGNELEVDNIDTGEIPIIPRFSYKTHGLVDVELFAQVTTSFNNKTSEKIKIENDYKEIPELQFVNPIIGSSSTFAFFWKTIGTDAFVPASQGSVRIDFRAGRL